MPSRIRRTLAQPDRERERLLAGILRRPELFGQISVLSVPRAVNSHALASGGLDAVPGPEDLLGESHGARRLVPCRRRNELKSTLIAIVTFRFCFESFRNSLWSRK
jgi:hypothetical protein